MPVHKAISYYVAQVNDSADDVNYLDFGTIQNRVLTQLVFATDEVVTGLYYSIGECDDLSGTGLINFGAVSAPNTRIQYPGMSSLLAPFNPLLLTKRFLRIVTNQPTGQVATVTGAYMEYPPTHPINDGSGLLRRTVNTLTTAAVTTILTGPADLTEVYLVKSVRVYNTSATLVDMMLSIVDSTAPAHTPLPIVPTISSQSEGFEFLRDLEPTYIPVNNLTLVKNQDLKIQTDTTDPVVIIVTYSVVT